MKRFINENFILNNKTAEKLYHNYSESQPIIDFHCHLSPAMISDDRQFNNLTQAWLEGDHYKWRAIRTNGINEMYCTGNASDPDSKSGLKQYLQRLGIHYTTGHILNLQDTLTFLNFFLRPQHQQYMKKLLRCFRPKNSVQGQ